MTATNPTERRGKNDMKQEDVLRRAHEALAAHLPADRPVEILEAGGGSFTHVRTPRAGRITVLDISPEQLERNDYADEKILGNLEDPGVLKADYDLVVCFDVLEHLERPDKAFANMVAALRPGGLLVVGCPDLFSTKGLLTKFTPHGFHVWYYRTIRGDENAGRPGYAPFPTHLRLGMGFEALKRAAQAAGLEIVFARRYVGPAVEELKARKPLLHALYALPALIARIATAGRIELADTDWLMVLRRPPGRDARILPQASEAAAARR